MTAAVAPPPARGALRLLTLAVLLSAIGGWLLLPRLLDRSMPWSPLLWESRSLEGFERLKKRTWETHVPEDAGGHGGTLVVLEDGRPLELAAYQRRRRMRPGTFALRRDSLLVSPTDASDPRVNGHAYEVAFLGAAAEAVFLDGVRGLAAVGVLGGVLATGLLVRRRGGRASLTAPLSAVAGFAGVGILLGLLPLSAGADRLGRQIDQVRAHRDDVAVIAIGASTVLNHFDPEVFDRAYGLGDTSRVSYNLGDSGMSTVEALAVAREVLRRPPPNLEWLIVDSRPSLFRNANLNTRRGLRAFRVDVPPAFVGESIAALASDPLRTETLQHYVLLFVRNLFRVGRGVEWLEVHLQPPNPPQRRGYVPLLEGLKKTGSSGPSARFLRRRARFEAGVDLPGASSTALEATPAKRVLVKKLATLAQRRGIRLAFVIPPSLTRRPTLRAALQAGEIDYLLDFNDPSRYPELYALENRAGDSHLNATGARIFSRALGERLRQIEDGR